MGGGGGSPPSSPPPSSPPPSSPGGNGGGNKPKCEKCGVNDATTEFKLTVNGETKILILCDVCCEELDKCKICKTEKSKHIAKNGSCLCEKCYYCSKCKANEAIVDKVVDNFVDQNNKGQVIYEGSACEACIRELIKESREKNQRSKCKDCQQEIDFSLHPPMLPPWSMKKTTAGKTEPIYCWPCIQKRVKEEKQGNTNTNKTNKPANPSLCKGCNKELPWERRGDKIITTHIFLKLRYLNGNRERHGSFCRPCAEEFKSNHQQTCSQCGKREWPEIKKGWALDFENQALFCSYGCRFAWLEKHNEPEEKDLNKELDIELFPDEVELDGDSNKKDFDLEKEADKKEIFKLKEFSKKLKENVPKSNDPELSDKEKKMAEYFLKLTENSKKKAEQDYGNKYGKSELEDLLTNSNQTQQPKKNYLPLVIGIGLGVVGLIGGLVYYFWIKKKPLK